MSLENFFEQCFFCSVSVKDHQNKILDTEIDETIKIRCQYCGEYALDREVFDKLRSDQATQERLLDEDKPHIISNIKGWMYENRQQGILSKIDEYRLKFFLESKPLDVYERAYKLLKYLSRKSGQRLGEKIIVESQDDYNKLIPACYAYDSKEVLCLLDYLSEVKYINYDGEHTRKKIVIKPNGFAYLEEHNKKIDSNIGFCAMWFGEELNPVWENAIEPAIHNAGYDAKRIDKHHHVNGVVDEIMALIRRSKFIVADFTGNCAGVYFEAGFAKGLGVEVIFTCKKEDFEKIDTDIHKNIHFNVKHFTFILWEESKLEEFKNLLSARIEGTFGQGRNDVVQK